jgi:hypothetical protein
MDDRRFSPLPLYEWDATGNYHLDTPYANQDGVVYYRNAWPPTRWGTTQR